VCRRLHPLVRDAGIVLVAAVISLFLVLTAMEVASRAGSKSLRRRSRSRGVFFRWLSTTSSVLTPDSMAVGQPLHRCFGSLGGVPLRCAPSGLSPAALP
jgi:hypothetical protein